uniref:Uncharacterized protein n=2 Tax=Anguilla anguilla TaxID=7936 RepID=A0A0E9VSJ3_ANGAN
MTLIIQMKAAAILVYLTEVLRKVDNPHKVGKRRVLGKTLNLFFVVFQIFKT